MTVRELIEALWTMPPDLPVKHYSDIVQEFNVVSLADVDDYLISWQRASDPPPDRTERCVVLAWEPRV